MYTYVNAVSEGKEPRAATIRVRESNRGKGILFTDDYRKGKKGEERKMDSPAIVFGSSEGGGGGGLALAVRREK